MAQNPITLTDASFLAPNDVLKVASDTDGVPAIVTPAGPNQNWYFEQLTPDRTSEDTVRSAANDPIAVANFPTADIIVPFAGFPTFADVTANAVSIIGAGLDFMGNGIAVPFTPPRVIQVNPFDYLDTRNPVNNIRFTIALDDYPQLDTLVNNNIPIPGVTIDSIRVGININSTETADSWGQVNVPSGSYDVLRIHTVNITNTTLEGYAVSFFGGFWIDLSGFVPAGTFQFGTDTTESYNFRSDLVKEDACTINVNPQTGSILNAQYRNAPSPLGVQHLDAVQTRVSIYPNPTTGPTSLSFENLPAGEFSVDVFDANGRSVTNLGIITAPTGNMMFDVSGIAAGIYWLRISDAYGNRVASKPLQVNR